jgi:hypothetical protein
MNVKALARLSRELDRMRGSVQTARSLEAMAKKLGRTPARRGKEPSWVSVQFPELRPVSIPHHGSRDLSPGVQRNILESFYEDIGAWEDWLARTADDTDRKDH